MEVIELRRYLDDNWMVLDNLEIYSILNCMSEQDIEILFFDYGLEEIVVKYIEKYIHEQGREYKEVTSHLLNEFEQNDVRERRNLRETLLAIIPYTDNSFQIQYFNLLANSENKIENRRAAQMSYLVWNEEIQQKIVDLYRENRDVFIAAVLIDNLSNEDISSYFKELWHESLRNSYKQKLIDKSNLMEADLEDFLKRISLKSYLLSLLKRKEGLDEIEKNYEKVAYEERTYIKWMAGKMRCSDLLVKLIEKDKNVEKEEF